MKPYKVLAINVHDADAAKEIAKGLNQNKVVHVDLGYFPSNIGKKSWSECYTPIAAILGDAVCMEESQETGDKTGNLLTDIKYPWHEPSQSYSHSNTRQPLHTDGSYEKDAPSVSYFCCEVAPIFGGATVFISNEELIDILEVHDKNLLKQLRETPIKFSKGSDFKERPIIGEKNRLTWNWHRCDQSLELTKTFHEFLERQIIDGGLTSGVQLRCGEALFFMDEEVLHGRNSFIGDRWLVKGGINYVRSENS